MGTIGCCAVSLALAQPGSSGERGLILSGCVWFLCRSIDPVATYLRGRAPRCLFWRREGIPCKVALTIHTVHQSSLRPKREKANGTKCCVCIVGTSAIKCPFLHLYIPVLVCAWKFAFVTRIGHVMWVYMFVCMRGMVIKHSITFRAEQHSSLLGYRGLDKDYGSQWQAGLSVPLPAQNL